MQGTEYLTEKHHINYVRALWLNAAEDAIQNAKCLHSESAKVITKQLCNRLLEPFMYHKVIMTSSKEGLDHFFKLRCPEYVIKWQENVSGSYGTDAPMKLVSRQEVFKSKGEIANYRIKHNLQSALSQYITVEDEKDVYYISEEQSLLRRLQVNESQAEIHIQALAEAMYDAYKESTPQELDAGEWHIPFCNEDLDIEDNLKVATANCARVSYTTVGSEKTSSYENDIRLYNTLLESGHLSPFEHCAQAMAIDDYSKLGRNFVGFKQYRAIVEEEV
jgi:thymidylate synthase ThyX